ncbi:tensin-3 [Pteropus vampyrus]|uniref:Tensin-3 n=1 Tax=Pteropus vampyrus TaxID=132908 RepID=A0A6P6C430_PTEVA|nr:tensin-3 [Pteropus vampyrus]
MVTSAALQASSVTPTAERFPALTAPGRRGIRARPVPFCVLQGGKGRIGVVLSSYMHFTSVSCSIEVPRGETPGRGAQAWATDLGMGTQEELRVPHLPPGPGWARGAAGTRPGGAELSVLCRYVQFLSGLLSGTVKMNASPLFLHFVILHGTLNFDSGGACRPFLKLYQAMRPVFTSGVYYFAESLRRTRRSNSVERLFRGTAPDHAPDPLTLVLYLSDCVLLDSTHLGLPRALDHTCSLDDGSAGAGCPCSCRVSPHQVKCYHQPCHSATRTVIFWLQFHTGAVQGHSLMFGKEDLDGAREGDPRRGGVGGQGCRCGAVGALTVFHSLFSSHRRPRASLPPGGPPHRVPVGPRTCARCWPAALRPCPHSHAGCEHLRNDHGVSVDFNTADPLIHWDSYENLGADGEVLHTQGPVDGSLYARVRKKSTPDPGVPGGAPAGPGGYSTQTWVRQQQMVAARQYSFGPDGEAGLVCRGPMDSPRRAQASPTVPVSSWGAPQRGAGLGPQPPDTQRPPLGKASRARSLDVIAVNGTGPVPSADPSPGSPTSDIDQSIEQLNRLILELDPTFQPLPTHVDMLGPQASSPTRQGSSGDEPLVRSFRKLSLGQYDNDAGGPPAFPRCGWGQAPGVEQAPGLAASLSPADAKEMVLAPHPADLDGVDGRIFSPRRSGREPLASARASPVSPATPYVTTPPRHLPSSPPGPQVGSAGRLYHAAHGPSKPLPYADGTWPTGWEGTVTPWGSVLTLPGAQLSGHVGILLWLAQFRVPALHGHELSLVGPPEALGPLSGQAFLGFGTAPVVSGLPPGEDPGTLSGNSHGAPQPPSTLRTAAVAPDDGFLPHGFLAMAPGHGGHHGPALQGPPLPEKKRASEGDRSLGSVSPSSSGFSSPHSGSTASIPFPHILPDLPRPPEAAAPSPDDPGDKPVSVNFVQDTSRFWYKADISREQAIAMLKDKEPGSFIVRDSHSFRGAYGLAMKVATPPPSVLQLNRKAGDLASELVRHFLVECTPRGVRLKGCSNEPYFGSLTALVSQHAITPLALPCKLLIPDRDPLEEVAEHAPQTAANSAAELLKQGAACNVWYLNSVEMESLTGHQAVQKALSVTLAQQPPPLSTVVHFKVSAQGITLTDSQRRPQGPLSRQQQGSTTPGGASEPEPSTRLGDFTRDPSPAQVCGGGRGPRSPTLGPFAPATDPQGRPQRSREDWRVKRGHAWDPDEDRGPVVVPPVTGPAGETAPLGDLSTALFTQNARHMRHRICGGTGPFRSQSPSFLARRDHTSAPSFPRVDSRPQLPPQRVSSPGAGTSWGPGRPFPHCPIPPSPVSVPPPSPLPPPVPTLPHTHPLPPGCQRPGARHQGPWLWCQHGGLFPLICQWGPRSTLGCVPDNLPWQVSWGSGRAWTSGYDSGPRPGQGGLPLPAPPSRRAGAPGVFGFVARKQGSATDNACHLFAEHDPEQPASAIVNFVSKVMIGSPRKI